jgi:hypothetical protein
MNRRLALSLVFVATPILCAGLVRAQQEAQAPPHPPGARMRAGGPGGDFMVPPMGDKIELLGFAGMHGGKTVTGAPFSAVAVSVTRQTLSDGNQISRTTQTNLFRDSQGRFRKEVSFGAIGPLATAGQPKSFVFINDPVTKENFVLHPEVKTAEKVGHAHGGMKGMRGAHGDVAGAGNGRAAAWEAKAAASGNFKKEDLGTQVIAGVSAQGTRYTRTIPVGQIGNKNAIVIVSEHWYSADLQMTVMSKRTDPRYGETSYTLSNIQRSEPAAALFAVPSDYAIQQHGAGRPGMKMRQAPTAVPPPENN